MNDAMDGERCRCASFRNPIAVFTLHPTGLLDVRPDTLSSITRAFIVQTVRPIRANPGRTATGFVLPPAALGEERPVAIGYLASEDTPGFPDPTVGFLISTEALGELFEDWYEGRRLLPEPISGDQPGDSTLFVTVETPSAGRSSHLRRRTPRI
jgi:hypothetical protein